MKHTCLAAVAVLLAVSACTEEPVTDPVQPEVAAGAELTDEARDNIDKLEFTGLVEYMKEAQSGVDYDYADQRLAGMIDMGTPIDMLQLIVVPELERSTSHRKAMPICRSNCRPDTLTE